MVAVEFTAFQSAVFRRVALLTPSEETTMGRLPAKTRNGSTEVKMQAAHLEQPGPVPFAVCWGGRGSRFVRSSGGLIVVVVIEKIWCL